MNAARLDHQTALVNTSALFHSTVNLSGYEGREATIERGAAPNIAAVDGEPMSGEHLNRRGLKHRPGFEMPMEDGQS